LGYSAYHCDDHWERHAEVLSSRSHWFSELVGRSTEDRLRLPIERQVEDEFDAYRLEFPLVLEDLDQIEGPVIAEAAALLPELLAGHDIPRNQAVWLVPTEDFQRQQYGQRAWAWGMLRETSDPCLLFDRWTQRDAVFAAAISRQAESLGYRVIVVDGSEPIETIEQHVNQHFISR
jgi:hypothetical protein